MNGALDQDSPKLCAIAQPEHYCSVTKSSITKDCNKCTILWGDIKQSVMKHSPLCFTTCVQIMHSSLVTLHHNHRTVIRFSTHLRLCVFMQLKGIGLYQTEDYYLLHWVREDLIQLANSPFPPPRFKERIIFFFFPFAQPSWRVTGKQSCNKNASVSIKQRRDKNRRL